MPITLEELFELLGALAEDRSVNYTSVDPKYLLKRFNDRQPAAEGALPPGRGKVGRGRCRNGNKRQSAAEGALPPGRGKVGRARKRNSNKR